MNKIYIFIASLSLVFLISFSSTGFANQKLASFNTVPLAPDSALSPEIQEALKKNPPLNVFRMVANVPQSFEPQMALAKSLLSEGKFNPRLREIAILRVAHLTHSAYEWHQHTFLAKANGVTQKEMDIIQTKKTVHRLDEEANFVCRVADELTINANLTDETFKQLYGRYDIEKGTELILTISFFNMLSRFLNGTRVEIEKTNPLEGHTSPIS